MKTPREILFGKHKIAEVRLDKISERVVAECGRPRPQEAADFPVSNRFAAALKFLRCCARGRARSVLAKLWQELVWPCRRIWAGMAAVWVVVLLLGFASAESGTVVADNTSPPPTPEVMMALKEQKRMMAQLLDGAPSEAVTRPRIPGPRSEQRQTIAAV